MDKPPHYDVILIGGGPAALAESLRLKNRFSRIAVVSSHFGGCLDIMGDMRLQSYIPELTIAGAPRTLTDFMDSPFSLCPTGREYANYIRASFEESKIEMHTGSVETVTPGDGGVRFRVTGNASGHSFTLHADRVVLATGLRPKSPDVSLSLTRTLHCFDAYAMLARRDVSLFCNRHVCIVGSGNTAFQLAQCLTRLASRITILAKRYVGFYPMDIQDHFALRAPSLSAIERIHKTTECGNQTGPVNDGCSCLSPMYLHVYDRLWEDNATNRVCARLPVSCNNSVLLSRSLQAASAGGSAYSLDHDFNVWNESISNVVVVHAIGVEANLIATPLGGVLAERNGFIRHSDGRTEIPGLYVIGSAAGYRSINRMRPLTTLC